MTETQGGPLSGLLVIDVSRALAGPTAAMLLGDLGARVTKVERSGGGDEARQWGPPFAAGRGQAPESTYFLAANRSKQSVSLDLKSAADLAAFRELLGRADVLIENFRPGTLRRLGFGGPVLTELNPALVTLSISGFGHDGPEGGKESTVQIACDTEARWRALCDLLGLDAEQPGMSANADRVRNRAAVTTLLEHAFAELPVDSLLKKLGSRGIPAGRIRAIDEVYEWDQTRSQHLLVNVDHGTLGPITRPGPPLRFFSTDDGPGSETTRRQHVAPPVLGADTAAIRAWLDEAVN